MLDIGWSELVLIGVVALIVVGPKDLPEMFRTLGRLTAKARMMARDFQRAMEDAADSSGIKDVSRDLNALRSPLQTGLDGVNRKLDQWEAKERTPPPGPARSPVASPLAAAGIVPPVLVPVAADGAALPVATPVADAIPAETPVSAPAPVSAPVPVSGNLPAGPGTETKA